MPTPLPARRSRAAALLAGCAALAVPLAVAAPASAAVTATFAGGTLTASSDGSDGIAVTCVGGQVKVNGLDPAPAATCAAVTKIVVTGGPGANDINLGAVTATDFTAAPTAEVRGGGGNDLITGTAQADVLLGEAGNDRVIGFRGNDTMDGGDGDDTLVWNNGDGTDKMDGQAGADTTEVNGSGAAGDVFTVNPNGARVKFDRTNLVPFALDIGTTERLNLNGGGGDDSMTGAAGLAALITTTMNGQDGNDTLTGTDGGDLMLGGTGNDRLVGARGGDVVAGEDGDDTMVWNNGDGSDQMDGQLGADTVEVNGAGTQDDTFTVNPNGARVKFDRTNLVPFALDIGTTEKLNLNGGGGNDSMDGAAGLAALIVTSMNGQDGNDTLDGTDGADSQTGGLGNDRLVGFRGNDAMDGGEGDDIMVWNNGDGSDKMDGQAGKDTTEVNGSATDGDDFTVKPNGARVDFDRINLVPFSLDIGTTEQLRVNGAGGDDRITGANGLAKLIASTFDGGEGDDRIKGTDGKDVLAGGSGNDRIRAADRARDQIDCGSGNDRARIDGRDRARDCEFVIGSGGPKVLLKGKRFDAGSGAVRLALKCDTRGKRCVGFVQLKIKNKVVGRTALRITDNRTRTVRVKLNTSARRALARGPRGGLKAQIVTVARDGDRNGWETTSRVKVTR